MVAFWSHQSVIIGHLHFVHSGQTLVTCSVLERGRLAGRSATDGLLRDVGSVGAQCRVGPLSTHQGGKRMFQSIINKMREMYRIFYGTRVFAVCTRLRSNSHYVL